MGLGVSGLRRIASIRGDRIVESFVGSAELAEAEAMSGIVRLEPDGFAVGRDRVVEFSLRLRHSQATNNSRGREA